MLNMAGFGVGIVNTCLSKHILYKILSSVLEINLARERIVHVIPDHFSSKTGV